MVTAAALLDTQKGPIIGVFHEYAHLGKGRSIHAAGQMECKQTSQHRRAPRVELICTGRDQPKSRIRIFQHVYKRLVE